MKPQAFNRQQVSCLLMFTYHMHGYGYGYGYGYVLFLSFTAAVPSVYMRHAVDIIACVVAN